MTYKEIIAKLSYLKSTGEIADYLIDSESVVVLPNVYVKTRLTIFNDSGKPQVTTGLVQGVAKDSDVTELQERSVEIAYSMNEIKDKFKPFHVPEIC